MSTAMKSAIFQEQKRPTEPRAARKFAAKKRPGSLSPFKSSPAPPNGLSWNLDDMISSYTASGALPTPLSPTLPPQFPKIPDAEDLDNEDDDDSVESDMDNMPMSLLLPTLPVIFTEPSARDDKDAKDARPSAREPKDQAREASSEPKTPLAHPLPKKPPSTVSSVLTGGNLRTGKVRWVNRASNTDKPRFLLRMTFKLLLAKYKSVFHPKLPTKVHGLGIEARRDAGPDNKAYWLAIAKETHEYSEKIKSSQPLLSVIVQFDWLLVLCIAYDHDERSRILNKTAPTERLWLSLYKEIAPFVTRIEKYIKANDVADKQKSYLSFLVGILAILKALVLKRINAILQGVIDTYLAREPTLEVRNKAIELQKLVISKYHQIEDHFGESQSFFSNCPPPATIFPRSWHNRSGRRIRPSDEPLSPSSDKYYLPLGPYSDLREGCAYLYACLNGFVDVTGPDINGGVRYNFQSGSKNSS